jgi:hypothetical protein
VGGIRGVVLLAAVLERAELVRLEWVPAVALVGRVVGREREVNTWQRAAGVAVLDVAATRIARIEVVDGVGVVATEPQAGDVLRRERQSWRAHRRLDAAERWTWRQAASRGGRRRLGEPVPELVIQLK